MDVVFCLTSHDRIDCAKINQEIIKLNYAGRYGVVHVCSGAQKNAYIEDAFAWREPKPLHRGAIGLMQASIQLALERFDPKWVVHLEADTWLLDESVLVDYVRRLEADPNLVLATSAWMPVEPSVLARVWDDLDDVRAGGLAKVGGIRARVSLDVRDFATQFFVMRSDPKVVDCVLSMQPHDKQIAERQFFRAVLERFDIGRVLRMREREPVHPYNRWACARLSLHSEHWPAAGTSTDNRPRTDLLRIEPDAPGKREALLRHPNVRKGDALNRLLTATDYDYYNPGAARC